MLRIRKSFQESGACLYMCSTPIGNLEDATFRLLDTLKSADMIAAEDTRQTRKLLTHYDIHPRRLVSYHEHNQKHRVEDFIKWWAEGKSIALVTDAGTPVISDPGDSAVSAAIEHDVPVIPVPGASAVLSALVGCGLPAQPFTFVGFLNRDDKAAAKYLSAMDSIPGSLVLYEAPHRLLRCLRLIQSCLPKRPVVLAKELTKTHETFVTGELQELIAFATDTPPRGEYVLVVGPKVRDPEEERLQLETEHSIQLNAAQQIVADSLQQGLSHADAVRLAVQKTGARRKDVYRLTIPR